MRLARLLSDVMVAATLPRSHTKTGSVALIPSLGLEGEDVHLLVGDRQDDVLWEAPAFPLADRFFSMAAAGDTLLRKTEFIEPGREKTPISRIGDGTLGWSTSTCTGGTSRSCRSRQLAPPVPGLGRRGHEPTTFIHSTTTLDGLEGSTFTGTWALGRTSRPPGC